MTSVKHDARVLPETPGARVDLEQAAALWRTLAGDLPPGAVMTVLRARKTRRGGDATELVAAVSTEAEYLDAITRADGPGVSAVYVSVNALDGVKLTETRRRKPSARGGKQELAATLAVVADLDHAGGAHAAAADSLPTLEQLPDLLEGLPAPALIVDTGGGWHVWWTLTEPAADEVSAHRARQAVKRVLKRNADALGVHVDAGVTTDAARILRVPGTWNRKRDTPEPVRILATGDPVDLGALLALDTESETAAALEVPAAPPPPPAPTPSTSSAEIWDTFTGPASGKWIDAAVADFDRRHTWEQVLPEWTYVETDDTGTHYLRPGNTTSQKSATVHHDTGRLMVWSESTAFGDTTGGNGDRRTFDKLDAAIVAAGATPSRQTRLDTLRALGYGPDSKNGAPVTAANGLTATPEGDRVHPESSALEDLEEAGDDDLPSSWRRIDLGPLLDGTYVPVAPALLPRTDGVHLLYPGHVHSLHGESESGKSLVMQAETVRVLSQSLPVLFLDFESDEVDVVGRLLTMGAAPEDIRAHFHYVRPETRPATAQDIAAYRELLGNRYTLVIVDGVTDALGIWATGASSSDNDAVAGFMRTFPRRLARRTGAAVVLIDHVAKDAETRGRMAIGAQAKMSGLDGAAYTVEVDQMPMPGSRGVLVLRVGKDRPAQVRRHCGPFRKSDRSQEAARVVIDSTGPRTVVTVEPWRDHGADDGSGDFRPTGLMEKVSRAVESDGGALSLRDIRERVKGRAEHIAAALAVLVAEGYLAREPGPRGSQLHTAARRYRQVEDPASDRFRGTPSGSREPGTSPVPVGTDTPSGSGSRSKDRGTGNQSREGISTGSGNQSGTSGNQSLGTLDIGADDTGNGDDETPRHGCAGASCQVPGCSEGGR